MSSTMARAQYREARRRRLLAAIAAGLVIAEDGRLVPIGTRAEPRPPDDDRSRAGWAA